MPPLRLGWTWSTSPAFSSGAFDSFGTPGWAASPAFSAAFDFFGASPPGWAAAISSSSVQIASRSRAIDASCSRKNSGALLEPARVRQKRKLGEMGHPPGASCSIPAECASIHPKCLFVARTNYQGVNLAPAISPGGQASRGNYCSARRLPGSGLLLPTIGEIHLHVPGQPERSYITPGLVLLGECKGSFALRLHTIDPGVPEAAWQVLPGLHTPCLGDVRSIPVQLGPG